MQNNFSHTRNLGPIKLSALLAGSALLALGGAAHADVKIVSSVTITSQGRDGTDQTQTRDITAYFQGTDARLEAGPGMVEIIKDGKAYRLNDTAKTYSVMQLPPNAASAPPPSDDTTTAPVAPPKPSIILTATSGTQTTAGLSATDYTVDGIATVPARRMRGGGGPGGGGDNGNADDSTTPVTPPKVTLSGDLWLAALPSGALPAGTSIAPYLNIIAGRVGPLGGALSSQLATKGLFPVASKTTSTTPGFGGTQRTTKIASTVSSVSTTALDASLFTIPTDYTETQPQFGGGGFGGGGGGRRGGFGGGQGGFGGGPGGGGGQGGPGAGGPPPAQ